MKKLLSMALALVMSVTCVASLAACDQGDAKLSDAEIVAEAISTLKVRYADQDETTAVSYGVLGQAKIGDESYPISWSVSSEVEGYGDYVSVGSMNATTKLVAINISKVSAALEYTLKATVTVGDATDSISFKRVIPESAYTGTPHSGNSKEDPYAAGEVIDIARTLQSGKYYLDDEGKAKKIYVHGYVVDAGRESKAGAPGEGRMGYVYIADTYSADMTKDSKNTLYVYSLTYDDTYIKSAGDLAKGDEVILWGYIENYNGTPEITYSGNDIVTCVSKKSNRTPAEMIATALANVKDTFTVSESGETLPASSVTDVTFKWAKKSGDFAATVAEDGTITFAELPEEDQKIVVTVTASCTGADDDFKDVTVTIKAAPQSNSLKLTGKSFSILDDTQSSTYNKYKGDHTVGNYTVNLSDVMVGTSYGYSNLLQFKASTGKMTVTGEFLKITLVFVSTYDADNTGNKLTVKAGTTELTGTTTTVNTGEKSGDKDILLHTVVYTVTGSGDQTITLEKTTSYAAYLTTIEFEIPEPALSLTGKSFSILDDTQSSTYNKYKGDQTVGNYTVNLSDVMVGTQYGYNDLVQFKASSGKLTVSGDFTKITLVFVSTYDANNTGNKLTVKAGETELTGTTTTVNTGEKSGDKDILLHTVVYTVTGKGTQTITLEKTTSYAAYLTKIEFMAPQPAVALTGKSFSILDDTQSSTYNKYKGDQTVGNYTVNLSDVMVGTQYGYSDLVQFKASSGKLTISGDFTKIVLVFISTYDADNTGNKLTVKAGTTELTGTTTTVNTGEKSGDKDILLHTVEFTVTGTGTQTITLEKTTSYAAYLVSIAFYA